VLSRALTDPGVRPLPAAAEQLVRAMGAPPRLAAHLRAVHHLAAELTGWLAVRHPELDVDHDAVLFGAATHDIGKVIHIEELSGPGSRHEAAGQRLLLDAGVEPRLARFAGTHGTWWAEGVELEDLLVSTADKVWKGKRVTDLDQSVVDAPGGPCSRRKSSTVTGRCCVLRSARLPDR
jgi:HD domain-containing protein